MESTTMELAIGGVIAFAIAVTGVGAGTITAPLLIFFLGVPIELSVGTALAYSAIVKIIIIPVQIWRKQIHYRIVGIMLIGGLPGVVLGVLLFHRAVLHGRQTILYAALGTIIVASSAWHLYTTVRPNHPGKAKKSHLTWLAAVVFPIGAEMGLSSSGAGALGSLALLNLTTLSATQVVGTDLALGLCLSFVGGGLHILGGSYDAGLLLRLVIGGAFGALIGCAVATRVPNRQLRLALGIVLLSIGLQFCYRATRVQSAPSTVSAHVAATAQQALR